MPVLTLVAHLALVHADALAARVAELGVEALEAAAAVGSAVPHDVALSAELAVTLEAAEVFHVPATALRLRALVSEDDLATRGTERDWLK